MYANLAWNPLIKFFKCFIYYFTAVCYPVAPRLHKIRKTMYFLIYLYRQCLAYFLLLAHQRPFKQSQCLLLLLTYIVHFFDHCLSEFTIVLDHSLDSELCKVKLVFELRDIEIYLFLSCRLDLKFDVINLLMK